MALDVRDIASPLSPNNLDAIRTKYDISDMMAMEVPNLGDRACNSPDGFITVYEVYLKCGLHLPIPLELYHIMMELGVLFARL
ncbi:hypothetical protein Nepgr_019521 [Nepenthes gracilis]|uniref:Uncharacterized protein n=1 Tax=Nepenthes gracilis TaxID=150966 RepID=A0AAD3SV86_NEPGR|nr:hypothetical protein Nepgr_019521 [Nepenthes gracilis]